MSGISIFREEERGVSPVIGVILMVAITVILAAVVGAFVFGFDGGQETSPSVAMESSVDGQTVEFSVSSGDSFDPSTATLEIDVTVKNATSGNTDSASLSTKLNGSESTSLSVDDDSGGTEDFVVEYSPSISDGEVTAGDSLSVTLEGTRSNSDLAIVNYDAKIVRQSNDGSSSSVLFSDTGSASASSSSGSTSNFDITAQYETMASGDPKYTVTYDVNNGYSLDASEYKLNATFDVVNTTTGDVTTRVISHDQKSGKDNLTQDVWLTSEYDCPDTPSIDCENGLYATNDGDGTLKSGDRLSLEIYNLPPKRDVESYTVKIIEIGSGDVEYKDTGTP